MGLSIESQGLFSQIDPPLFLVTAHHSGRRSGLISTWISPVTLEDPPQRIALSLSLRNFTTELALASGKMGIHLLSVDQLPWVERFGLRSGRDGDKFRDLNPEILDGVPLLPGSIVSGTATVLDTVAFAGMTPSLRAEFEAKFDADKNGDKSADKRDDEKIELNLRR